MSATKARFGVKDSTHQCRQIARGLNQDSRGIAVTLLDQATGITAAHPLDTLPRTEWLRVWSFLKLGDTGCNACATVDVRTADNDAVKDAVSHALREHHADRYTWSPGGNRHPTPAPLPTPVEHQCQECAFSCYNADEMAEHVAVHHEPPRDLPAPEPTPRDESPARDAFTDLVHSIATGAAREVVDNAPSPGLDVDAVNAIIAEATAEFRRPIIHRIEVRGAEPRDLPHGEARHAQFDKVLRLVGCGMNVFLVGPPGTGKTTLASQVAEALHGPDSYGAISCYATMPASALWGFMDAQGRYVETEFYRRYVSQGGVFLFDEIDNGHAGTLAAANQALANGECAFPTGMQPRHDTFGCIAAGNTYGNGATRAFMGRNALDKATKDRFKVVTVPIDERLESDLAHSRNEDREQVLAWITRVRRYRRNVETHGLEVVVSPRTTIDGATMLAAGFTADECAEMTVLDGLSNDQRAKVTA